MSFLLGATDCSAHAHRQLSDIARRLSETSATCSPRCQGQQDFRIHSRRGRSRAENICGSSGGHVAHSRSATCTAASLQEQQLAPTHKTDQLLLEDEALLADDDEAAADWDVEWVPEDQELEEDDYLEEEGKGQTKGKRLPAEVRCFDTAKIFVQAGDGGRGCVAFRREKFVPKGGPAGGNGGTGGNIWAVVDESLNSLSSFRRQVHFRGAPGQPGGGAKMAGRAGVDMIVRLPPGTIVRRRDAAPDEPPLAELVEPGSRALLAAGGRGGRGNASFKTGRNTAPAIAENGEAGASGWLDLELRLVADVGIVGVPNAGKSTLLSMASAARPKIADYPFTTLTPNLGVVEQDFRSSVWADIPGLLEGAHAGAGLGHEFLRHCQRCRLLVHVIDGASPDPCGDFSAIQQELALFSPGLAEKRQIVAYNKMDLPDSADYEDIVREYLIEQGVAGADIFAVSAATGAGVTPLVRAVRKALDELPVLPQYEQAALQDGAPPALNLQSVPGRAASADRLDDFEIVADLAGPRVFVIRGKALERFAQMTNWNYYEAARRFQKVLEAAGVVKALERQGVQEGDTVVVGELELEWSSDRSEARLFDAWQQDRKAAGKVAQGSARWPHAGGG